MLRPACGIAAACVILRAACAWAEQPVQFRPPPQGLVITYDDGRTYTFGSSADRLTEFTVTGSDLKRPVVNVLRDVFFFAGEQAEHYRYGYDYKFERDISIWPLEDAKVVRATYSYNVDGVPAGTGDLQAAVGSPEKIMTPAGEFTVRRVMVMYESRPWRGASISGMAVCLYAPAIGYCVGLGIMERDKPARTSLATDIKIISAPQGKRPERR